MKKTRALKSRWAESGLYDIKEPMSAQVRRSKAIEALLCFGSTSSQTSGEIELALPTHSRPEEIE